MALRFHSVSQDAPSHRSPASFATNLWRYRDLLWQFTQREVELRHKGSHLGLIWSLLNPLLMLGLYVVVFTFIFNARLPNESRIDYALGVFLGLTIFQFLAEIISVAPMIIVGNPNFVKKVVFPLEILPASTVGAATFHLLVSIGLLLIGVVVAGDGLTLQIFWLPLIVLPLACLALGLAWTLAALGVFFRDLSQLAQFLSLVLMYASAVFYPVERIPGAVWQFLRLNPLLLTVDMARNAVLWNHAPNFKHLGYVYIVGLAMCYLGHHVFRKLKPAFADVL